MTVETLMYERVFHATFGEGTVVDFKKGIDATFTVKFSDGISRIFRFPDAIARKFIIPISEHTDSQATSEKDDINSIRERLKRKDNGILDDIILGKYRIGYDFSEANSLIPSLSVFNDFVPTETFWDLAVKLEFRLKRVMAKMEDPNLSTSEILSRDYLNIYLTGEPGTGKTTMIERLCSAFGLPFYVVNISANIEEDTFTGMNTVVDGQVTFSETPFLKAYKYGGVVLLDEINAANPAVTLVLNDALVRPFVLYENGSVPRERHPLCCIAAASNPTTAGICPINEATERRFNVAKCVDAASRETVISFLSKEYHEPIVKWVVDIYEKCRIFLKNHEADSVYMATSIDTVRAVLNDIEEGRDCIKSLDNFYARAATRDPELAEQMKVFLNSMVPLNQYFLSA